MAEDLEEELDKHLGILLEGSLHRGLNSYQELGQLLRRQKVLTDRILDVYLRSGIEYRIKGGG